MREATSLVQSSTAALLPGAPSSMAATDDWDVLLEAVKARLRSCVAALPVDVMASVKLARIQQEVQECASALDQLQHLLLKSLALCDQGEASHVKPTDSERRARHLVLHDELTSLPNRRYFRERLDQALRPVEAQQPSASVLYLDLDGFKRVNDLHGPAAGDDLLRVVAARLSRVVRVQDMVSRLGGDEFACLPADRLNREQLVHLAAKMFDAVSAPVKIGALVLNIRPSIGIAVGGESAGPGDAAAALMKQANDARFRAKRTRSGYAFHEPERTG